MVNSFSCSGAPTWGKQLTACSRSSGDTSSDPLALLNRQYTSAMAIMPPTFSMGAFRHCASCMHATNISQIMQLAHQRYTAAVAAAVNSGGVIVAQPCCCRCAETVRAWMCKDPMSMDVQSKMCHGLVATPVCITQDAILSRQHCRGNLDQENTQIVALTQLRRSRPRSCYRGNLKQRIQASAVL